MQKRKDIRLLLEQTLIPQLEKTEKEYDSCQLEYTTVTDRKQKNERTIQEWKKVFVEDKKKHQILEAKGIEILQQNNCSKRQAMEWEATRQAAEDWMKHARLNSATDNASERSAVLIVSTNTTTGRSGVGVLQSLMKGTTCTSIFETKDETGLGLIDAIASRLRLLYVCILPIVDKYDGKILRCGGENSVGPGGRHKMQALFSTVAVANLAKTEILKNISSISKSVDRYRSGGLVSIPSIGQRLGGITVHVVSNPTGWSFGACGAAWIPDKIITTRTTSASLPSSSLPSPSLPSPSLPSPFFSSTVSSPTSKINIWKKKIQPQWKRTFTNSDIDRIFSDFNLRDDLLTIGAELEATEEKKNISRLRKNIAAMSAVKGYSLVVVRLVFNGKRSGAAGGGGGSSSRDTSWDSLVPEILLLPPNGLNGINGNDGDKKVMPVFLCLQIFSDICTQVIEEENQQMMSNILTMQVLDEQIINPVRCYVSKSVSVLQRIVFNIQKRWKEIIKFQFEGDTLLQNNLATVASNFTMQCVGIMKCGPIVVNQCWKEGKTNKETIMMIGANEEMELENGFNECGVNEYVMIGNPFSIKNSESNSNDSSSWRYI